MSEQNSFSPMRKWGIALNVAVGIASFIALVVMFNYLSSRHHSRIHLSSHAEVELTSRTTSLLKGMTNNVEITVFFDTQNDTFGLYATLSRLLAEYKANSHSVDIRVVDYFRNPVAAQEAKTRFNINPNSDDNLVIVSHGKRIRVLTEKSLWSYELERLQDTEGKPTFDRRYRSFQGELLITSAIADVISPRKIRAYYVTDHNEHDPEAAEAQMGYAGFHGLIHENNIEMALIDLKQMEIPEDCDLLIIAGPTEKFHSVELDRLEQYLNQGGRMFVSFRKESATEMIGIEPILSRQWGVVVGYNLIVDSDRVIGGSGQQTARYGPHPITSPLYGVDLFTVFPRTIAEYKSAPPGQITSKVTELAFTGTNAVVFSEFTDEGLPRNTGLEPREEFPIAVAVEKGSVPGVSTTRGGVTRIVVVGDSRMFSNVLLNQLANRDFANQCLNWLVDRSELMTGVGPRPMQQHELSLLPAQMKTVWFILVVGMPLAALLLGVLVWVRRRR